VDADGRGGAKGKRMRRWMQMVEGEQRGRG